MRPCPYCGSPVKVIYMDKGCVCVGCEECGMGGPVARNRDVVLAKQAWDILCRKMCRKCNVNLIQSNKELRHEIESLKASLRMRS